MEKHKTLYQVQDNVKLVGERIFNANGYEFQRGFNTCFEFFSIALKHTVLYHQEPLLNKIADLNRTIEKQNTNVSDMAKVSQYGIMAIEDTHLKTINQLEQKVAELEAGKEEAKKKMSFMSAKIVELEAAQKNKKNNKRYKNIQAFIDYYELNEQLKAYLKTK